MKKILLIVISLSLLIPFSSAQSANCNIQLLQTTTAFISGISGINTQLSSCQVTIPSSINSLIGNGNILVTINMNSGITQQFYLTLSSGSLTSINQGSTSTYDYEITLGEDTLNTILQSSDPFNEILIAYNNNQLTIDANGFWNSIVWFFGQFFVPNPSSSGNSNQGSSNPQPAEQTGQPANCEETYLPGHTGYAENQELWDSYSSDTDAVCQTQYGTGTPQGTCIHTVQLSVSGNPYYLCWYNE